MFKSKMSKYFDQNFEISKSQNILPHFEKYFASFQNGAKYFEILNFQNFGENILKCFDFFDPLRKSKIC